ncbi:hypothetical protein WG66_001960 [Moniliophthora roreri]|nr:hypothetical protein WG66_001960 [Moniliophthora roreri]
MSLTAKTRFQPPLTTGTVQGTRQPITRSTMTTKNSLALWADVIAKRKQSSSNGLLSVLAQGTFSDDIKYGLFTSFDVVCQVRWCMFCTNLYSKDALHHVGYVTKKQERENPGNDEGGGLDTVGNFGFG